MAWIDERNGRRWAVVDVALTAFGLLASVLGVFAAFPIPVRTRTK